MNSTVTLDNCEREPIHVPGAIQPHGVLVACRGPQLRVVRISANAHEFFGRAHGELLGQPLASLFSPGFADEVAALLERVALRDANPLPVIASTGIALDAVIHRSGDLLVLELERRSGHGGAFDPRLRGALARLQGARDVATLTLIAAREVRELTGFDRVMVYRFDEDWHGQVVAEDKRDDLEPFLGLHYPASDIPAQARALYTRNWLRLIGDVAYVPVPIVPALDPETKAPLDLSDAHLRSVSPIHIEYLTNMGVGASMSISLVVDGKLVGLIACHHYSGPRVVGFAIRETAEYLGQALSWHLRVLVRADEADRERHVLESEAAVAHSLAASDDLLDALGVPALLDLAGADGAAIVLDDGVRRIGATPDEPAIANLVRWLRTQGQDVYATDHLAAQYPKATECGDVAGVLAVALSDALGEYLLWFRPAIERTVDWAGDPRKQAVPRDDGAEPRLSPRGSFELWRETVRGRSLRWQRWHMEAASNLRRLLLGGARRRSAALRALNERLAEADRAKDLFIATVSHELRNPLNAISGWAQLSVRGGLSEARREEAVRVIARNADALAHLVDDLLDVSRIVSGKLALEVESVDVAQIVESVIAGQALAAEAKQLRLKTVLDTGPVVVLGDAARIRQVVLNLLSNAIKFTPKQGSVNVSLERRGSDIEIGVRDSGVGIDGEALPHVFQPFWQADHAPARKAQGLGLGLAIAKRLVELHGGAIAVQSEGPGKGTTFIVRLPVASAVRAVEAPAPARPVARRERPLAGVALLVVEDEMDSRDLLQHILEDAGAHVTAVGDGQTALALLGQTRFDALVSDIGMPEMDGLSLVSLLRADTKLPGSRIPAVALTAYSRAHDRTAALRAGFQAHVPKPADPDELVAVVASVLRRG